MIDLCTSYSIGLKAISIYTRDDPAIPRPKKDAVVRICSSCDQGLESSGGNSPCLVVSLVSQDWNLNFGYALHIP